MITITLTHYPKPCSVDELEAMRREWAGKVSSHQCTFEELVKASIDFTSKLQVLLMGEGIQSTYTHNYGTDSQYLVISLPLVEVSIYVCLFTIYCVYFDGDDIQGLLDSIHRVRVVQEAREYCHTCKYSNDTSEYCGVGLELAMGCTYKVIEVPNNDYL